MSKYICMSCGFMGDFDDFSYGDCPACGSEDCGVVSTHNNYDLDHCLDFGEASFDMGEY
jgi:anaerobic ribonucleoside-triphosphate reductase